MEIVPDTQTAALAKATTLKEKVEHLLSLEKITLEDIEDLNQFQREYLAKTATEKLAQLKGTERDNFLDKIDAILHTCMKSSVWEYNHAVIRKAIFNYMCEHGVMPTTNAIAEETGLSRQTVAKHVKEYKQRPEFTTETEQFKFMAPKVLASVFQSASSGDVRAARLYFEMVGEINKKQTNTVVNEQNNYIQINNTILSQENLKQLSPAQLNQIESIIKNREMLKIS